MLFVSEIMLQKIWVIFHFDLYSGTEARFESRKKCVIHRYEKCEMNNSIVLDRKYNDTIWSIGLELNSGDGAWMCAAIAHSKDSTNRVFTASSQGQTAEAAMRNAIDSLRDATAASESNLASQEIAC